MSSFQCSRISRIFCGCMILLENLRSYLWALWEKKSMDLLFIYVPNVVQIILKFPHCGMECTFNMIDENWQKRRCCCIKLRYQKSFGESFTLRYSYLINVWIILYYVACVLSLRCFPCLFFIFPGSFQWLPFSNLYLNTMPKNYCIIIIVSRFKTFANNNLAKPIVDNRTWIYPVMVYQCCDKLCNILNIGPFRLYICTIISVLNAYVFCLWR